MASKSNFSKCDIEALIFIHGLDEHILVNHIQSLWEGGSGGSSSSSSSSSSNSRRHSTFQSDTPAGRRIRSQNLPDKVLYFPLKPH